MSLFGISNLESLRLSAFEGLEFFDSKAKTLSPLDHVPKPIRGWLKYTEKLPHVGEISKSLTPLYFSSVRDAVVCFDDLERRDESLSLRSVIGLAHFLREKRNCRIIFLLNSDALTDDKCEFESYFEKTFDGAIKLEPSVSECVDIAFRDFLHTDLLSEYAKRLPIHNIRILRKTGRAFNAICETLEEPHPNVLGQIVHTTLLLGWCHYKGENAPPLDFVIEHNPYRSDSWSDKEKAWAELLSGYGFSAIDELDLEILNFFRNGHLNIDALQVAVSNLTKELTGSKGRETYRHSWRNFNASLSIPESEVVEKIKNAFLSNLIYVSPYSLNSVANFFERLDRQSEVDQVIEEFFEAHKSRDKDFWDIDQFPSFDEPWHPKVVEKMKGKYSSYTSEANLGETLQKLGAGDISSTDAFDSIKDVTKEEIRLALMNTTLDTHRNTLKGALNWRRIVNASEEQRDFTAKVVAVLEEMAAESKINELRLSHWGILPKKTHDPK